MKTSEDKLLEEIADDFNQYLRSGKILFGPIIKKIDPNLSINNIRQLLKIHFVLTKKNGEKDVGVIDFIENLVEQLRNIKKNTKRDTKVLQGLIKGKINWRKTYNLRNNQNIKNLSVHVCYVREKNYEIPENLVLKALLKIIFEIINDILQFAFDMKYNWLNDWFNKQDLRNLLTQTYLKNIYLKRIDLKDRKITDRIISRAKNSRYKIYRDASKLLIKYQNLMRFKFDKFEVKELLRNTFIKPEKIELLFELYWIIKIINQFRNCKFHLIRPGNNIIAEWEDNEYKYKIYHNSIGSFKFLEHIKSQSTDLLNTDNFCIRLLKVYDKLKEMINSEVLWHGRPDIILEKYDKNGNLISILIGEVKYTKYKDYAIIGLKQLLEYIALIKYRNEYVEMKENLFDKLERVNGTLFLDKIRDLNIKKQEKIQIIQFGERLRILI